MAGPAGPGMASKRKSKGSKGGKGTKGKGTSSKGKGNKEPSAVGVERTCIKIIKDHLPHVGDDGAEVISAVVLEQYADGDDVETITATLVDMLPSMLEDDADGIDDVETAAADLLDALDATGGVLDQMSRIAAAAVVVLFEAGAECLALLAEDDAWHPATMVEDGGGDTVHICFEEYTMERHLPRDTVVLNPEFMEHADDDEGLDLEEGECSVCGRDTKLTRHHMIPRSEHRRYEKRKGMRWLASMENITLCCRKCHSMIHRCENNRDLADNYSTIDDILQHPKIGPWALYMSKR